MFLNEAPVRRNTDRRIRRTVAMPFNKGEEIEEKGTEHDRFCRVPVRDPLTLPEIHMVTWMDGTCLVRGFHGLPFGSMGIHFHVSSRECISTIPAFQDVMRGLP